MRRFSTILLALVLAGALCSPAMAQLFKDDFTGAAGDTLNTHGYIIQGTSYTNPISVVTPGLTYGVYPGSGIGNAVALKSTGQDLYATFPADSTGSLYASFMVNLSAAQVGDYFFAFSPTYSSTAYTLRLFAKTDSAGGFFLGVTKSNETPQVYGTTHLSLNTTYLVVVKYSFVAADSNDLCSVYALAAGDLPATEPTTPEIDSYNGHARGDVTNLGSFTLRQGTATSAPTMTFDGIRIATSWAGVLGIGATAEIAPKSLDFGKLIIGSAKTDSVLVKNTGTQALEVSGVTSSDAAFVVTPATASIAARDSAWFRVVFTPAASGAIAGTMTFHSNATPGSDSVVTLAGAGMQPGFSVSPASLNFGKVWTDTPKTDTLTVTNGSDTDRLYVDSVKSSNPNFSAFPPGAWVEALQSEKFAITFHPTVAGPDTGYLVFYHSAATHQDTVMVTGTGAVKVAALVLGSPTATFSRTVVGQSKTDSVKIKNTHELPLTISEVTSKDTAQYTVVLGSTSVPAGDSTYVKVTFHPQSAGVKADTIVFASNAPEGSDTLFVSGVADVPAAMFSLATKNLNFGNLRVGQFHADTLKIKNPGELTLRIAVARKNETAFMVTLGADTVLAGDSTWIALQFSPVEKGTFTDTLVFTTNTAEVTDTLTMRGTGNDLITIAAARALPNGTEVIVRGIVTRTLGSYTFIQDTTGGIIMYSNAAGNPGHDSVASGYIAKGDLLEIDGRTSEYRALKEIGTSDILSFLRISRGNPLPEPKRVTLTEIAANGEQYEAQLITVKKVSFTGTGLTTFANATSYAIVDTSAPSSSVVLRIQNATDTQLGGMDIPTGTFTFTGVLGQFSSSATGGYQLLPVDSADVKADIGDGIAALPNGVPTSFQLAQNFPNPFNPTTTIQYALPTESRVTIRVYSVLGQEVRTLVNETQKASYYRVVWDGMNSFGAPVATGVYFFRISAEPVAGTASPFVQVKKMIMVK